MANWVRTPTAPPMSAVPLVSSRNTPIATESRPEMTMTTELCQLPMDTVRGRSQFMAPDPHFCHTRARTSSGTTIPRA